MRLLWSELAWDDYEWWQRQDRRVLRRVNQLLRDIRRDPYQGIGRPEQLRGDLTGWWSRRIDDEHRLVYRYRDDTVEIASCRYHYGT
ncbi:MAG: Txe/YoeB family addiction module toxin [Cellulomonas sp.]|jgi:toxin YoeB|nr:Txe/YoeB family addiction module toxin [Cellulomonas sp.]